MSLLDKFKKKPSAEKKSDKEDQKAEKEKDKQEAKMPEAPLPSGKSPFAYRIIKEPHITEKASDLNAINKYVFKVFPKSNKSEIKKAVEALYNVKVENVRIINLPAKKRRLGLFEGEKPGYKKAIITLKKGHKIELISH